jgi:hypothetical protein
MWLQRQDFVSVPGMRQASGQWFVAVNLLALYVREARLCLGGYVEDSVSTIALDLYLIFGLLNLE